jgi:hypothetical protein
MSRASPNCLLELCKLVFTFELKVLEACVKLWIYV